MAVKNVFAFQVIKTLPKKAAWNKKARPGFPGRAFDLIDQVPREHGTCQKVLLRSAGNPYRIPDRLPDQARSHPNRWLLLPRRGEYQQ